MGVKSVKYREILRGQPAHFQRNSSGVSPFLIFPIRFGWMAKRSASKQFGLLFLSFFDEEKEIGFSNNTLHIEYDKQRTVCIINESMASYENLANNFNYPEIAVILPESLVRCDLQVRERISL